MNSVQVGIFKEDKKLRFKGKKGAEIEREIECMSICIVVYTSPKKILLLLLTIITCNHGFVKKIIIAIWV